MVTAANAGDLNGVLSLYGSSFQHDDGLTLDQVKAAIAQFWQQHEDLKYTAQIQSWEERRGGFEAVVTSTINGIQTSTTEDFQFAAISTVRNLYQPDPDNPDRLLLIKQTVESETTSLKAGDNPPSVTLNLPTTVSTGSVFDVEAVVKEPLGDRILLGAMAEDLVTPAGYLKPPALPLQPLLAGGLFRRTDAPSRPGAEWISVMLVDNGGTVLESRRLNVVSGPVPTE
jgi:hypothetical protein